MTQTAMGKQDGDFLEIKNAWARVTIVRDRAAGQPDCFVLTGDLADTTPTEFATLAEALKCAWTHLEARQNAARDRT